MGITSDDKCMPPIFFGKDKKCNTPVYYEAPGVIGFAKENYPEGN